MPTQYSLICYAISSSHWCHRCTLRLFIVLLLTAVTHVVGLLTCIYYVVSRVETNCSRQWEISIPILLFSIFMHPLDHSIVYQVLLNCFCLCSKQWEISHPTIPVHPLDNQISTLIAIIIFAALLVWYKKGKIFQNQSYYCTLNTDMNQLDLGCEFCNKHIWCSLWDFSTQIFSKLVW